MAPTPRSQQRPSLSSVLRHNWYFLVMCQLLKGLQARRALLRECLRTLAIMCRYPIKRLICSLDYFYSVLMKGITWSRDSHGLFDYESRHLTKKTLKASYEAMIMRSGNDLMLT